jgi:SAM-dependent methyltransferase
MSGVFDDVYAGCYDLLYRDKDYEAEAAYVADCLKRHGVEAGAILDLGSGTGKHALEFVRMGYDVLGVDRSGAMVRIANERSPQHTVGRAEFEIGDVRTYRSSHVFDAVVSLFHVVSYQTTNEDLVATFETAAHHLRRGGLFLFDCWYGPAVLAERPSARIKRIADQTITVMRIAEPLLDVHRNLVTIDYTMLIQSTGREQRTQYETHRLRYLFEPEISYLLKQTGFQVCDAHEWLTRRSLGCHTWCATFLAKRR